MSVKVAISCLTQKQGRKIEDELLVVPEVKINKFDKNQRTTKKTPIQVYHTEGEYVYIPFYFALQNLEPDQVPSKTYPTFDQDANPYVKPLRDDKIGPIQEALDQLEEFHTTSLKLYPGFGKTILASVISHVLGYYTIVLLTSVPLVKGWVKVFKESIPSLAEHVWVVGEKMPVNPIFVICMEERIDQVPEAVLEKMGTLVIDEAQTFCTPSRIRPMLKVTPLNVIACTATLGRNDSAHQIMYPIVGTHCVCKISNKNHRVVKFKTNIKVEPRHNTRGPDFGDLQRLLSESDERNLMVVDIIKSNPHKKFMILTSRQEHCRELDNVFSMCDISHDTYYGTKNTYKDSHCLIGTVSKIGVGFDEENMCDDFEGVKSDVLILLTSLKAEIIPREDGKYTDEEIAGIARWEQIRGRVMRSDDPIIIYFVDNHPIPKKHFRGIVKWVESTNGKVFEATSKGSLVLE